jgi:hypothetical protein
VCSGCTQLYTVDVTCGMREVVLLHVISTKIPSPMDRLGDLLAGFSRCFSFNDSPLGGIFDLIPSSAVVVFVATGTRMVP